MKRYFYNLAIWATQTLNVWTGGDPDQTLSGRTGIAFLLGKPWGKFAKPIIDHVFKKLKNQDNHCVNAIEWDEIDSETLEKLGELKNGKLNTK